MPDMKNWYESKAVWGGIVAAGASLAGLLGVDLPDGAGHDLVEALTALAGAIGGIRCRLRPDFRRQAPEVRNAADAKEAANIHSAFSRNGINP